MGTYELEVAVWYPWGTTKETITVIVSADCTNTHWYQDQDKDGYGSGTRDSWSTQFTCSSWENYKTGWIGHYVDNNADCNDRNASIHPGAEEIYDGIGNNCNGLVDESNGVSYKYYHGSWSVVPDFSKLEPVKTGIILNFSTVPKTQSDYYGFSYSANIEIATAGNYTFYTRSDDGSKLYINGQLIVNNDGIHGARDASGNVYLPAGSHAIKVEYFERTGWEDILIVTYAGPGFSKRSIPTSILTPTTDAHSQAARAREAAPDERSGLSQFTAYPNPVANVLTVETGLHNAARLEVQLYNLQGARIYKGQHQVDAATGNIQLDLGHVKQGIYMLRIQGEDLKQSLKIVKE